MWSPTHIQVTVQRAKGLLAKGKNGTNNCFVTIAVGKEKYQTSVKEKAEPNVSWNEECELKIPDQGNRAELVLTCLHRNNLGIDEFLGQVTLPLNEMDAYDRPRSKWFKLESKPGKEKKNKERGELEARITFIVKSGSLTDLSKKEKHKSSIGQLANSVGGSLLSIGTIEKRKGIKKFAKSLGSKMHLHSKKKNKEGDDASSYSGSMGSLGTPNNSIGGSHRYGQRAGEADPGVISEDEDEFVFDNLSHKSSASSLNIRSGGGGGAGTTHLQPSAVNYVPRNPSPLLGGGKFLGKQNDKNDKEDTVLDFQADQSDQDQNAHTLPPPSKPPRTQMETGAESSEASVNAFVPQKVEKPLKLDEWESKLYGKHLDIGSSDSLKRRSWELTPVPLPVSSGTKNEQLSQEQEAKKESIKRDEVQSDSSTSEDDETFETPLKESSVTTSKPNTPSKTEPRNNLYSPDEDAARNNFDHFNASFAQFEQRNSSKIFSSDTGKKWHSQSLINEEKDHEKAPQPPQVKPRNLENKSKEQTMKVRGLEVTFDDSVDEKQTLEEMERLKRTKEGIELEEESQLKLKQQDETQKRRDDKRRAEDLKLLNFARQHSTSVERENGSLSTRDYSTTPEQSPKQAGGENREKRLGKFKFFSKRDKNEGESSSSSPKSNERIIIGHEKSTSHAERRSEITAALTKKYEGKSREELMLIANGMENEALHQRQRVKELEDYLDNLLLRVMETHPKLLQNPYSRTTSAKSG